MALNGFGIGGIDKFKQIGQNLSQQPSIQQPTKTPNEGFMTPAVQSTASQFQQPSVGTELDKKVGEIQQQYSAPKIDVNKGFGDVAKPQGFGSQNIKADINNIGKRFSEITNPQIAPGLKQLTEDKGFQGGIQFEQKHGIMKEEFDAVQELSPYEMQAMEQKKLEGFTKDEFIASVARRRKSLGVDMVTAPTVDGPDQISLEGGLRGGAARNSPVDLGAGEIVNPYGLPFEQLDDLVQKIGVVDFTAPREEQLKQRLENMPQAKLDNYKKEREKRKVQSDKSILVKGDNSISQLIDRSKAKIQSELHGKTAEGSTLVGQMRNIVSGDTKDIPDDQAFKSFVAESELGFVDQLVAVGTEGPKTMNMLANIPGSALKTITAVARGLTNPLDTMAGLYKLVATKEGRQALGDRYGSREGLANTIETDPTGTASDVLAIAEGGAGLVKGVTNLGAKGATKMGALGAATDLTRIGARAGKFSKVAGGASDLGLRLGIDAAKAGILETAGKVGGKAGTILEKTAQYADVVSDLGKISSKAGNIVGIGDKQVKIGTDTLNKNDKALIDKGIAPTVVGKKGAKETEAFQENVVKSMDTILENKDKIKLVDENGEIISSKPESLLAYSEAIGQTKPIIFNKYNDIKKSLGEDVKIPTSNILQELNTLLRDRTLNITDPGIKDYIRTQITELSNLNNLTPTEAQTMSQRLNNSLTLFYKKPNPNDIGKNMVNALINNNLKKELSNSIMESVGDNRYDILKKQYSELLGVEKEVAHRALVEGRKANKGLLDMTDVFTAGELMLGISTMNPAIVAKSVVQKGMTEYFKFLNNPNNKIKKLFNKVESGEINAKAIRGKKTPFTQAPVKPTTPAPKPKQKAPAVLKPIGDTKQTGLETLGKKIIKDKAENIIDPVVKTKEMESLVKKLDKTTVENKPKGPDTSKMRDLRNTYVNDGLELAEVKMKELPQNLQDDLLEIGRRGNMGKSEKTADMVEKWLADVEKWKANKGLSNLKPKTMNENIVKPKATVKVPESKLITEAKKYKSADEFIEANATNYHGTKYNFSEFDNSFLGTTTEAGSAKQAHFFTNKQNIAEGYANLGDSPIVERLSREVATLEKEARKTGKWGKYEKANQKLEELTFGDENIYKGKVLKTHIDMGKTRTINMKGQAYTEGKLNNIITQAKKEGYDSVVLKNSADAVGTPIGGGKRPIDELSNVIAIFDSKNIKTESQLTDIRNKANKKGLSNLGKK